MNYTAVDGDNLWAIYKRNKAKGNTHGWGDYKAANPNFKDGQTMHEGDSITIPEKIIPDEIETKIEEPIKKNNSVEEAKKAVDETPNESENHIDKSSCCCMVAPWTVQEVGRSYILKVTKKVEENFNNKVVTISKPEEPTVINITELSKRAMEEISDSIAYKKLKRYFIPTKHVLHVVAPEIKGAKPYKKIIVEHEFLSKKNELYMVLETVDGIQKLKADKTFEIDSSCKIKKEGSISPQKTKKSDMSNPDFFSDVELILCGIFKPETIAKKINIYPDGCEKKCLEQPMVTLYVYPLIKLKCKLELFYAKERKQPITNRGNRVFKIKKASWTSAIEGEAQYGSRIISAKVEAGGGGEEYTRKTSQKERKELQKIENNTGRDKNNLLNKIEKIMYFFTKADEENKKSTYPNNVSSQLQECKQKCKELNDSERRACRDKCEDAQKCLENYPVFTFDPGKTGITVEVADYAMVGEDDKHTIGHTYKASLKIDVFKDAKIEVDAISLLISRARGTKAYDLLNELRYKACKGFSVAGASGKIEAAIKASLGGGGSLIFNVEKTATNKPLKITGNGDIFFGISATASVKIELELWVIVVGGEATGVLASALDPGAAAGITWTLGFYEDPKYPEGCWKTGFYNTGIALHYILKAGIDMKDVSDNNSDGGVFGTFKGASAETKGSVKLIDADDPKKKGELEYLSDMVDFLIPTTKKR